MFISRDERVSYTRTMTGEYTSWLITFISKIKCKSWIKAWWGTQPHSDIKNKEGARPSIKKCLFAVVLLSLSQKILLTFSEDFLLSWFVINVYFKSHITIKLKFGKYILFSNIKNLSPNISKNLYIFLRMA